MENQIRIPDDRGVALSMQNKFKGFIAFLVLCLFAATAAAQSTPTKAPANLAVSKATLDMLTSLDLSDMSASWWQDLAADIDEKLLMEGIERDEAMRKVIFLSTYYPDKANFDRCATELYNIYRFNPDEGNRVMALAALYASGDDSAMRLIAYHAPYMRFAPWEDSDLVRHVTESAIMRYYGTPSVTVEPPAVIGGKRGQ